MNAETIEPEKVDGRIVIASVSGGKDSGAMCLALKEAGIAYRAVFMDTGWENPATYEYIREYLPSRIGPIETIRGEHTFQSLVRSRGTFPRQLRQFCTTELKLKPMRAYIDALIHAGEDIVNAVGIRRQESARRSVMGAWDYSAGFDCDVWRPIIMWSEEDVIAIHRRHNMEPNPLYLRGMSRVGCWPCIHASKSDLRILADDEERVAEIRALEAEIGATVKARADERGVTYDNLPSMFSRALPERDTRGFVAIDDVLRWVRTSRGGRQYDLFAETDPPACMRWGLCDGG